MSYREQEDIEALRKQCERDKLAIQEFWDGIDPYDASFADELNELWESTLKELKKEKK